MENVEGEVCSEEDFLGGWGGGVWKILKAERYLRCVDCQLFTSCNLAGLLSNCDNGFGVIWCYVSKTNSKMLTSKKSTSKMAMY
jgi:hypothetical protein